MRVRRKLFDALAIVMHHKPLRERIARAVDETATGPNVTGLRAPEREALDKFAGLERNDRLDVVRAFLEEYL